MEKALAYNVQGLSGSDSAIRILSHESTTKQVVSEVSQYISTGSLTKGLDLLENRGLTGDVAIFFIANFQTFSCGGVYNASL